jgi:hypothetical protein
MVPWRRRAKCGWRSGHAISPGHRRLPQLESRNGGRWSYCTAASGHIVRPKSKQALVDLSTQSLRNSTIYYSTIEKLSLATLPTTTGIRSKNRPRLLFLHPQSGSLKGWTLKAAEQGCAVPNFKFLFSSFATLTDLSSPAFGLAADSYRNPPIPFSMLLYCRTLPTRSDLLRPRTIKPHESKRSSQP